MVRRITIIMTIVVIAVSLAVGVYLVSLANAPSRIDKLIGEPVSATDLSGLYRVSLQPYGPSATGTSMMGTVKNYGGTPLTSDGKPVVVYIGADYCEFCAVQRWSLVMALMRFGNISGLEYMASASGSEGDYPTFTFTHVSYTSPYIVLQSYEVSDRSGNTLTTVPSTYSSTWQHYGSYFPFMNFGNTYVVSTSMLLPAELSGKNWSQVITGIKAGDPIGLQIKQSANLITALICKVTGEVPAKICNASPIPDTSFGIAGPTAASLALGSPQPLMATRASPTPSSRPAAVK